jgi:hypothetical protein
MLAKAGALATNDSLRWVASLSHGCKKCATGKIFTHMKHLPHRLAARYNRQAEDLGKYSLAVWNRKKISFTGQAGQSRRSG